MMRAIRSARYVVLLLTLSSVARIFCYSNLTNNDPYPVYTALYPYTFLTTKIRDYYKYDDASLLEEKQCVSLSISPFRQAAVVGRDINKEKVELGDLRGRWNMIALFYPAASNGSTAVRDTLVNVLGLNDLLDTPCTSSDTSSSATTFGSFLDPAKTDLKHEFGFFSVPIKYRKYGVRFELDFQFADDWGFQLQTGVVDLIQTASFTDLTCQAIGRQCPLACDNTTCCDIDKMGCDCKRILMLRVMNQKELIAKTLHLGIKNFNTRSMEDTHLSLYWRRVFPINQHRKSWPYFLLMPFFSLEVIAPTGKTIDYNCLFALPTGNNGHAGLGFGAGLNFDFIETIEIGIQASMTNYLSKNYCNTPVPTHELQQGMFPYKANFRRNPGTNWTFSALMHARHFLYWLSLYAQWVAISHGRDCFSHIVVHPFTPGETPPQAIVQKMVDESRWHSHVINVGATYDISPNITLGLLWQTPISRRNAYRSTTILGSIIVNW